VKNTSQQEAQYWIVSWLNSTKCLRKNSHQFPSKCSTKKKKKRKKEKEKEGTHPNSFYEANIAWVPKLDKDTNTRKKL
jgi:GTP-dependent phosphoenolpyruvate carboxykinase